MGQNREQFLRLGLSDPVGSDVDCDVNCGSGEAPPPRTTAAAASVEPRGAARDFAHTESGFAGEKNPNPQKNTVKIWEST